jgi:hypothetical protein
MKADAEKQNKITETETETREMRPRIQRGAINPENGRPRGSGEE